MVRVDYPVKAGDGAPSPATLLACGTKAVYSCSSPTLPAHRSIDVAYTLMSHGRALGATAVELPPPAPRTRSWQFIPTPAFVQARELFAALPAAIEESQEAIPTQGELEAIPEAERESRIRELLRADSRMARFIELSERLEAMALELVDEEGVALEVATIGVTELAIGAQAFRDVLLSVDAAADLTAASTPPFYLLVASL